jgi:hypothetical protein
VQVGSLCSRVGGDVNEDDGADNSGLPAAMTPTPLQGDAGTDELVPIASGAPKPRVPPPPPPPPAPHNRMSVIWTLIGDASRMLVLMLC